MIRNKKLSLWDPNPVSGLGRFCADPLLMAAAVRGHLGGGGLANTEPTAPSPRSSHEGDVRPDRPHARRRKQAAMPEGAHGCKIRRHTWTEPARNCSALKNGTCWAFASSCVELLQNVYYIKLFLRQDVISNLIFMYFQAYHHSGPAVVGQGVLFCRNAFYPFFLAPAWVRRTGRSGRGVRPPGRRWCSGGLAARTRGGPRLVPPPPPSDFPAVAGRCGRGGSQPAPSAASAHRGLAPLARATDSPLPDLVRLPGPRSRRAGSGRAGPCGLPRRAPAEPMSAAPVRSPTLRPHRMKKEESFLGKLGGTLARKKKAKEGEFAGAGEGRNVLGAGVTRGRSAVLAQPIPFLRGSSGGAPEPRFVRRPRGGAVPTPESHNAAGHGRGGAAGAMGSSWQGWGRLESWEMDSRDGERLIAVGGGWQRWGRLKWWRAGHQLASRVREGKPRTRFVL